MATISDVARKASVSAATVSRVLNRTRYVSPELSRRVLHAVKALGFRPSLLARGLRVGRSRSVGLVVSDILSPFFARVARAIEDRLKPSGYSLIICNTDEELSKEREYIQVLTDKQVDGIILAPTAGDHRFLCSLRKVMPIVLINRRARNATLPLVATDNRSGAHLAVDHLLAHGHRRIAAVFGLPALSTTRDRLTGYSDALKQSSIPIDASLIAHAQGGSTATHSAIRRLLGLHRPPTAMFIGAMSLVVDTLVSFQDFGVRCPQDMAAVSFTDYSWCQVTNPPMTAVMQPAHMIGVAAADLFLQSLAGTLKPGAPAVILPPELIKRGSCGCPSAVRGN